MYARTWTNHPFPFCEIYGNPTHQFPELTPELVQAVRLERMQHNKLSISPCTTLTFPLPQHETIIPSVRLHAPRHNLLPLTWVTPTHTQSTSRLRLNHVDMGELLPPLVTKYLLDHILVRKMEVDSHTHHMPSPLIGINLSKHDHHLLPHFKYG
jgi:hypothetical protein